MIEKKCEMCGEKITTNHPKKKWCDKCKRKAYSEWKKIWWQNNKARIKSKKQSDETDTKKKTNYEQHVEIEAKCKDMCISYGEYVRKYERGNYYG